MLSALLMFAFLVACGSDDAGVTGTDTTEPPPQSTVPTSSPDDGGEIDDGGANPGGDAPEDLMAAALEHLVRNDHTFGEGPPPFSEYLVLSSTDPSAGSAFGGNGKARALTDPERATISDALEPFGPLRFIDDAEKFRGEDLVPVIEGSVILGVGEPNVDGDTATIGVSLWCGGTCGTWITYQAELGDDGWIITGTEGPIAIS